MTNKSKPSRISRRRSRALSEGGAEYDAKRDELFRAAATIFREKGYADTTLNDIAGVMGVDRASLYYYIASKEELFQESLRALVRRNIDEAEIISAKDISARKKLEKLIALVINSLVEHYPYMHVYVQEDMRRVGDQDAAWSVEMVGATRTFEQFFIDAIDEGITNGELRQDLPTTLVANALFGMLMWTHRWFVPGYKYEPQDLSHTFITMFFSGVAPLFECQ